MDAKWKFLQYTFLSSSLMAGVQHSNIYLPDASDEQRARVQEYLRKKVVEMSMQYVKAISDDQHEKNIVGLAEAVSDQFGAILADKHFRIGNAQKILNLFLKFLWCVGKIPTPPHCPFDRRIVELLPIGVQVNWTKLDNIDDYRRLVNAARQIAKDESLSEWEHRNYQVVGLVND